MKLYELAKLIRSKNAGPFMLTIDILFEDLQSYEKTRDSGKINKQYISRIYGIDEEKIKIFECPDSLAIKISFPRQVSSGGVGDHDLFGGQQHGPLVELVI